MSSLILDTDGLGKDTKRYVLLLGIYCYFYNRFAFVVSALIFLHYVYTTLPSEG